MQPTLPCFSPRGPIHDLVFAVIVAAVSATHHLQEYLHRYGGDDTGAQNPHHHQVTPAVLVSSGGGRVARPPFVQGVRREDAAEVTPARYHRRGGCDSDLAVPRLEDLRSPGHGDRYRGAEAEADDEEAAVAWPRVGFRPRVCGQQETEDLEAYGDGEEDGSVLVEAVGERCD